MLLTCAIGCLVLLLATWGRQAVWSLRLALHYPLRAPPPAAEDTWPRVVVFLPLRGADPVLADCLRGLATQEYPRYEIRIILDHTADPAGDLARSVLAEFPHVAVSYRVLTERLTTCSLKVSAILQEVASLEPGVDVVATIDADVTPSPYWLRELVRPFRDPAVGVTTGLRWYHTHSTAWGSLVRHVWGGAAAAQMFSLDIPWGGTMAYRGDVVRDPELSRLWAHSFVEDTSVVAFLLSHGLKLASLPALTMVNPEAISLAGCYRFLRRQMLCVRLHHPRWPTVVFTAVGMLASAVLTLVAAAIQDDVRLAWTLLGTLVAGVVAAGLPLVWIDGTFYYTSPADDRIATLRWKHIPVVPLTLAVHLAALLAACFVREVEWRGIRYRLTDGRVERLTDGPYTAAPTEPDHAESIV